MKFDCRCKKVFCGKHRLPEEHGCTFDYRAVGRKEIEAQNPKITAEKLIKV